MVTTQTTNQNRFAEAFGYPKGRTVTKVKPYMTAYVQEFIGRSPFVVMATGDPEGHMDASPKGGKPGFVRVLDERRLLFPDVAGNKLFQTYQNLDSNPHVGLVFFIPGVTDTVRVNGRTTFTGREDMERRNVELSLYEPDDNAKHLQGIIIEVEESYGHCPRALNFSHLWDVEEIAANQAQRPISNRAADS
jgi:predicted pyridoxine 5'-phosphate oxidase superfamily flavin-nucleotide-binding protein